MVKILKPGRVVVILAGRYAGRKGVVLNAYDKGRGDRKFGHALIAGIDRYPRRITRNMGTKTREDRMKIKPFVKFINYNHVMPTRYLLDVSEKLSIALKDKSLTEEEQRKSVKDDVRKILEKR
ncbi:RPL27B [Symbiodinium sp. KB8]|nr:RPL27B [Symbiodinium sp. KB8]